MINRLNSFSNLEALPLSYKIHIKIEKAKPFRSILDQKKCRGGELSDLGKVLLIGICAYWYKELSRVWDMVTNNFYCYLMFSINLNSLVLTLDWSKFDLGKNKIILLLLFFVPLISNPKLLTSWEWDCELLPTAYSFE